MAGSGLRRWRRRVSSGRGWGRCDRDPTLHPVLIDTAKRRAAEAGLELTLEVADCEALPYENESFDIVSSSIGVIAAAS